MKSVPILMVLVFVSLGSHAYASPPVAPPKGHATSEGTVVNGPLTVFGDVQEFGERKRTIVARLGIYHVRAEPSECFKDPNGKCSYKPGSEHEHRWLSIRTPDKRGSLQAYRYALRCYHYGRPAIIEASWGGYLYSGAPKERPIHQSVTINKSRNIESSHPVFAAQYIAGDGHLHLAIGPINRFLFTCSLDFFPAFSGELLPHRKSTDYSAFTSTSAPVSFHPIEKVPSPPSDAELQSKISTLNKRVGEAIDLLKKILSRL